MNDTLTLTDPRTGAQAAIDTLGGTVSSLRLPFSGTPLEVLGRYPPELFSGRVLWPFCDRIARGRYTFDGVERRIPGNDLETGDAIHGFLFRRRLAVETHEQVETGAHLILRDDLGPTEEEGYPFSMTVRVTYLLAAGVFQLRIETVNTGDTAAPLTVGWHPYFAVPGDEPAVADTWTLCTTMTHYYPVDDRLIPSGGTEPVDHSPFDFLTPSSVGTHDYDVCLTRQECSRSAAPSATRDLSPAEPPLIQAVLSKGHRSIRIEGSGAFRRLQLFVPPDRGAIAIEPISAPAGAFDQPALGLTVLQPGESAIAAASVQARTAKR